MAQKLFKALNREISGLHEAAFLLAIFAVAAKVLALIRDRFLAHYFGASADLDIYYAAFRIPDFLYVSIASLVASSVLIPFFVEKLEKKQDAERFFNSIFTLFFCMMTVSSIIIFFLMPFLARGVAPGFIGAQHEQLVLLSRIILFSPFLLGLSGLFASVTQSLRRFFIYAIAPILYNVGIIVGIIVLYPVFGLPGLAYGVVLGAFLHMIIQLPVLINHAFVPKLYFRFNFSDIKDVLTLSLPRAFTISVYHITILVLTALASLMIEGSITIFNLSFNLQAIPLSIIGLSYSVAAFPTLSKLFSNGQTEEFKDYVISAMRHIIFWSFPALVLFIVLRAQIVRTIFGTGAFGWNETRLTAAALALFAVSIAAQSLILLLVRGYYAAGKTKSPFIVNSISSLLTIFLAIVFVKLFNSNISVRYFFETLLRVSNVEGSLILALPLAFSIGQLFNVGLLWIVFVRDFSISSHELYLVLRQSFYSSIMGGFAAFHALRIFDDIFDVNTFWGIFLQGALSGMVGILVGILILKLMGSTELREISISLRKKFWREKPILPDQEEL